MSAPSILVLGASSGFGAAACVEFARAGHDVFGVHLDRKSTLPEAARVQADVRALGRQAVFFNVNAVDADKRARVLDTLASAVQPGGVQVLLHSLAFGALKPLAPGPGEDGITQPQVEMTLDVMANSLVYWAQELVARGLMAQGGRIFAITSEGSTLAWPGYGAVSAAKCALEAYCRQLAVELAPRGITANAIRPGVCDTPALRKIPAHHHMLSLAQHRNPHGRLTTPQDVARCLVALARPETAWLTGNVLGVDGGEHIAG